MSKELTRLDEAVIEMLDSLRTAWRGPVKLTFIARVPDKPDADYVMTADNLDELNALIERTKERARRGEAVYQDDTMPDK